MIHHIFTTLLLLVSNYYCGKSEVLSLTSSNYLSTINENDIVLVEFYAPWCAHCKKFASEYDIVAEILNQKNIPVTKVNCVEETTLYWRNNINSYPTLKAFLHGEPINYKGELNHQAVLEFMTRIINPSLIYIDTLEHSFKSFSEIYQNKNQPVLVMFLASVDDEDDISLKNFDILCKKSNIVCGVSTYLTYATQAFQITEFPSPIIMLTSFENQNEYVVAPEGLSANGLEEWVSIQRYPLTEEFNIANDESIFNSDRLGYTNHILLFFDKKDESISNSIFSEYKTIASEYRGKGVFITVDMSVLQDTSDESYTYVRDMTHSLGMDATNTPSAIIVKSAKTQVEFYNYDGTIDSSTFAIRFRDFVQSFFGETMAPTKVKRMKQN